MVGMARKILHEHEAVPAKQIQVGGRTGLLRRIGAAMEVGQRQRCSQRKGGVPKCFATLRLQD
ncbi:hypothetical protein DM828_31650 [Pseudomonas umsongensis]|nr:hypothetical protein [Pseudomonas umsongensis]